MNQSENTASPTNSNPTSNQSLRLWPTIFPPRSSSRNTFEMEEIDLAESFPKMTKPGQSLCKIDKT
jgi:hypothetical protein